MLELAQEKDWQAVNCLSLQIHNLHIHWRPDIFCSAEQPYPKEKFLEDITNRMVYVAKIDSVVVGYVTLSKTHKQGPGIQTKKCMVVESICVEESLRGQGIGKAMMTDVRVLAKAFRYDAILLGVYPQNDAAVGFYQKCGFRIRSIRMDMDV